MKNRGSLPNVVLSLLAWFVFMVLLLSAVGFGIGEVELGVWLVLLAVGGWLIVRRFMLARSAA